MFSPEERKARLDKLQAGYRVRRLIGECLEMSDDELAQASTAEQTELRQAVTDLLDRLPGITCPPATTSSTVG